MYKRADPALYGRSEGQLRWKSNHLGARQVIIRLQVLQPFAFKIIGYLRGVLTFERVTLKSVSSECRKRIKGLIQRYNVKQ